MSEEFEGSGTPRFAPHGKGSQSAPPQHTPQNKAALSDLSLPARRQLWGRDRGVLGVSGLRGRTSKETSEGNEAEALLALRAGAQPGRQPRNPQPRDSTDHGARGRPHPPAAAATPGRDRRRRPISPGPGSRARREIRSCRVSLTIFPCSVNSLSAPLPSAGPAAHFRFRGPPPIRRKCVRPGEEGRRARGARRDPRGAGAPTLGIPRDPGPRAQ